MLITKEILRAMLLGKQWLLDVKIGLSCIKLVW
jgi:hypothetical protein